MEAPSDSLITKKAINIMLGSKCLKVFLRLATSRFDDVQFNFHQTLGTWIPFGVYEPVLPCFKIPLQVWALSKMSEPPPILELLVEAEHL